MKIILSCSSNYSKFLPKKLMANLEKTLLLSQNITLPKFSYRHFKFTYQTSDIKNIKTFCIFLFSLYLVLEKCHANLLQTADIYAKQYSNRHHSCLSTIQSLNRRLSENEHLAPVTANRERQNSVCTAHLKKAVLD